MNGVELAGFIISSAIVYLILIVALIFTWIRIRQVDENASRLVQKLYNEIGDLGKQVELLGGKSLFDTEEWKLICLIIEFRGEYMYTLMADLYQHDKDRSSKEYYYEMEKRLIEERMKIIYPDKKQSELDSIWKRVQEITNVSK